MTHETAEHRYRHMNPHEQAARYRQAMLAYSWEILFFGLAGVVTLSVVLLSLRNSPPNLWSKFTRGTVAAGLSTATWCFLFSYKETSRLQTLRQIFDQDCQSLGLEINHIASIAKELAVLYPQQELLIPALPNNDALPEKIDNLNINNTIAGDITRIMNKITDFKTIISESLAPRGVSPLAHLKNCREAMLVLLAYTQHLNAQWQNVPQEKDQVIHFWRLANKKWNMSPVDWFNQLMPNFTLSEPPHITPSIFYLVPRMERNENPFLTIEGR